MSEVGANAALDPERMEGQEIAGCKIVEKLATGGMGTVYRALQVSMNRQVAIKCLAEDFARDKQYVARFVREARAAGELSHTNLIHVLDVGVHQGVYYYIMEFVDGQSLDRILRIKERLGPETTVEILIQATRALGYAHTHEIIHRDIKPDNLMITKEGTVKIADLGIAKKMDPNRESTDAGLVLGTPNYMAPEQAQDASLTDRRSDVYALGSTAYHMLTGKPPYTGKNALEILTNVIKKRPVPIEKVRTDLPKGLVAILNRMMARDPEGRYQGMEELLKDLEAYKAGKFQPPKAERGRFDDEEEEDTKSKLPIELAETQADPVPAAPAAAAASSADVKLSGTQRVGPGSKVLPPGTGGLSESISAKALGAVQERPKSKLVPVLTLVGAVAVLGGGYMVVKKMTSTPPKADDDSGHRTRVEPVDQDPANLPGESEAKELLETADKMAKTPGTGRAELLKAYSAAWEKWPETPSGKLAKEAADRVEKEWVDAVEVRLAEARKLIPADAAGSFAAVFEALRKARQETGGRADLLKKVQAADRDADALCSERAGAFLKAARDRGARQEWEPAIAEAKKVITIEVEKHSDEAIRLISDWRERLFAEREAGAALFDKVFADACHWARGTKEEAKGEMRFDKALDRLLAAQNEAAYRQIRKEVVEPDIELMRDAASVVTEAFAQARAMIGKEWQFTKETFSNNKKVKILDVKEPLIVVEFSGRSVKTNPVVHEDILKLATVSLGKTVEGKARLAAYLFVRGEVANARRQIASFQDEVAQKTRSRIDEHVIRDRIARRSWRDLLSGQETVAWKADMKGHWEAREGGNELYASGEVSQKLLTDPPDENYVFELEARKDAGPSGCAVYFRAWGGLYQWQIGDAGNKYSVVRGLPHTKTDDVMLPGDPVMIRVAVLEDKAVGYLNGVRRWEILKASPGAPDPAPGVGIGAFNTLVRFRKVRIVDFK